MKVHKSKPFFPLVLYELYFDIKPVLRVTFYYSHKILLFDENDWMKTHSTQNSFIMHDIFCFLFKN